MLWIYTRAAARLVRASQLHSQHVNIAVTRHFKRKRRPPPITILISAQFPKCPFKCPLSITLSIRYVHSYFYYILRSSSSIILFILIYFLWSSCSVPTSAQRLMGLLYIIFLNLLKIFLEYSIFLWALWALDYIKI